MKTGSLEVRTGVPIVRVPLEIGKAVLFCIAFQNTLLRRDLSRVLSAKCNRFAYTYNKQGFLCKFSLLTLLMIATEPIPVPEELRQVQAHQGGLVKLYQVKSAVDTARRQQEQPHTQRRDMDMEW